jgi:putative oxidoreductase
MNTLKSLLVSNFSYVNLGLLLVRLGIGLSMMLFHGYGKISGGPERWEKVGANMANLGLDVFPGFWGFMAASAEFFGSILLILGILFRPAAALLAFTMLVAVIRHLSLPPDASGAGWSGASHALELLAVYLGLLLAGPGKYHVGKLTRS